MVIKLRSIPREDFIECKIFQSTLLHAVSWMAAYMTLLKCVQNTHVNITRCQQYACVFYIKIMLLPTNLHTLCF